MTTTPQDHARAMWWSGARSGFVAAGVIVALVLFAACGPGDGGDRRNDTSSRTASDDTPPDPVADLVGPACADYAKAVPSGAGSFKAMAAAPVATAARDNPLLGTFARAVSGQLNPDVDLVDLLNGGEYTIFAPVDAAFDKLPADTMSALADEAGGTTLSGILSYHVIPRRIAPADLVGTFMTVNGAELRITGAGDDIMVGDQAAVVCGGVQTANATVYLIDTVLMPPVN